MLRLAIAIWLLAPACPVRSELMRLGEPGGPEVLVGHYLGYVRILYGPDRADAVIQRLRSDVEGHESTLRRVVRERIALKSPLEFEFKYAAVDTAGELLLLRYFARHPDPTTIAGWQIQLLFSRPGDRLYRAYVDEVPLE